jgi:acyl-CoA synthetase (AMP-forming)/AMP-acid ligase II
VIRSELVFRTSFDFIERHAHETPDRIAVTGPGGDVSWARFRHDALRVACGLDTLAIQPGQIVAISHPDRYRHWLLMIACEMIGAVSGSFAAGDQADDAAPLLDLADFVLTDRAVPEAAQQLVTDAWIDGLSAPAGSRGPARPPATPDAPVRIALTSGSTGTPKCMMIRRHAQSHRIASIAERNSLDSSSRVYAAYPLSVNPNYYRLEACLRLGATVIFGRTSQDLVAYGATHCWLLPRDLVTLLDGVRGTWPSPQPLHLSLGGGPVSTALHDQAAAMLGTAVPIQYGTNETGFLGLQDREGIGTVWPENALLVVDADGRPLPEGEPGRIAARAPGMVDGYVNDPLGTRACFVDGWFLTDDVGVLLPNGRFRILGRRSEMINLGGLKLPPTPIEDALRAKMTGIRDIAVTSVINPHGIEEMCVAVVPDGSVDQAALFAQVQAMLPPEVGRFWLVPFSRLPLSAGGKLQRSALRDIFVAMRPPG